MTYIEGFVIAVPTANRDAFVAHARSIDGLFLEHGALRVVECWQENVAKGHTTDFFGAVDAEPEESVAFSWVEWPDRAARQRGMGELQELMASDPRFDPEKNPVPFDGKRMIFGCFQTIVERGEAMSAPYVQGFIVPVREDRKDPYRDMAEQAWDLFHEFGARRVVEAWGEDVPAGKHTDFYRAVKAEPGEKCVFSFIEWPSREVCDAAAERMQTDDRMQQPPGFEMPFDGKRMVYGGFRTVVEVTRQNAGA